MCKLSEEQKKEIVIFYQENNLMDTMLLCGELGYLDVEELKDEMESCVYYPYEEEPEYWEYREDCVSKLFDMLDISEEEFTRFIEEYENEESV